MLHFALKIYVPCLSKYFSPENFKYYLIIIFFAGRRRTYLKCSQMKFRSFEKPCSKILISFPYHLLHCFLKKPFTLHFTSSGCLSSLSRTIGGRRPYCLCSARNRNRTSCRIATVVSSRQVISLRLLLWLLRPRETISRVELRRFTCLGSSLHCKAFSRYSPFRWFQWSFAPWSSSWVALTRTRGLDLSFILLMWLRPLRSQFFCPFLDWHLLLLLSLLHSHFFIFLMCLYDRHLLMIHSNCQIHLEIPLQTIRALYLGRYLAHRWLLPDFISVFNHCFVTFMVLYYSQ